MTIGWVAWLNKSSRMAAFAEVSRSRHTRRFRRYQGMTLLKRSIAGCCVERLVIEGSVPFSTEKEFRVGPYLQVVDNLHRFVPMRRTALVEFFRLSDAIFDGQTAAIFKDGVHIAESYYSSHSSHRLAVDPQRVIQIPGNQPVFVAFHAWHDNYYHWLTQCIPSLFWMRRIC